MTLKPKQTKKCRSCKDEFSPFNTLEKMCIPCAIKKGRENKQKEFNKETRRLKKSVKKRSEWYADLQTEVNKYVRLTQNDQPCCTCRTNKPDIKYDAGHFISVGANKDLRFELTNIHRQCSVQCNQFGSGMRYEYTLFIIDKYGQDHLDWLKGPHKSLKEVFPTHKDIEAEIKRYRKLNRELLQNRNYP